MHREWGMPGHESYSSSAEETQVKQRRVWGGLEIQLKPRQFPDCVIHIRAVRLVGKVTISRKQALEDSLCDSSFLGRICQGRSISYKSCSTSSSSSSSSNSSSNHHSSHQAF